MLNKTRQNESRKTQENKDLRHEVRGSIPLDSTNLYNGLRVIKNISFLIHT